MSKRSAAIRMSQEAYDAAQARTRGPMARIGAPSVPLNDPSPVLHIPPQRRKMNKWETLYAEKLDYEQRLGVIEWYKFEGVRLRLADGAYFKPDFAVVRGGKMELHEVKGMWREAARVRIKVAADQFPFRFVAVTYSNPGWSTEEF